MAFHHQSTLLIIFTVVPCLNFLPVVRPQLPAPSPALSPLTIEAPGQAPVSAEVPGQVPVSAEVPVPPGTLQPQPQVTNMIEALRDAGRFGAVAGLLDGLQMKSLTPMTTWFLPNDQAFSSASYPRNVTKFLDYHVIRELLPFSRLLTLSTGTRMPTFLGTETIVVTSNDQFNFSIDNANVVVPDLYGDNTVAVHGIDAVLDDATYNGIIPPASSPSPDQSDSRSAAVPSPPKFNITFPNAAHGLYAAAGFWLTVASAWTLVAAV